MYIKDKKMLVFSFVVDLLWTAGGSSVILYLSEGSVRCKTLRSMVLG